MKTATLMFFLAAAAAAAFAIAECAHHTGNFPYQLRILGFQGSYCAACLGMAAFCRAIERLTRHHHC
jgi:hypothetical protein